MSVLSTSDLKYTLKFRSFGVEILLESNNEKLLSDLFTTTKTCLLGQLVESNAKESDHILSTIRTEDGRIHFFRNRTEYLSYSEDDLIGLKYFDSILRLTIFEHTTEFVFIHAGVVAIDDKALIIPGSSHKGKTTLVREMIKRGAVYYSDEYAVLGHDGLVYPYARELSIRAKLISDEYEIDMSYKDFGATVGTEPIPLGYVLFTEFSEGSDWFPQELNRANGVLEIIPHVIPIRKNTKNVFSILNLSCENARIFKTLRGEAEVTAEKIINLLKK